MLDVHRALRKPLGIELPRGLVTITCDIFDTVLLRDQSSQRGRFAETASVAARALDRDQDEVAALRHLAHDLGYTAVKVDHPDGEAAFDAMIDVMAELVGGDPSGSVLALRQAELEVEARHLRPNERLLHWLAERSSAGTRVVALSDTWHSAEDLSALIVLVVGRMPFDAVYTSADLGATKHRGTAYPVVLAKEGLQPDQLLHLGDDPHADLAMGTRAGWSVHHLPRGRGVVRRSVRRAGRLLAGKS